jgi:hypothetical protein
VTRLILASAVLLVCSVDASAQQWAAPCTSLNPAGDCVKVVPGERGPMGPAGPQGPPGRDGKDGAGVPGWPSTLAPYDFLTGPVPIIATVPKQDGYHDKLLYRPGVAALVTRDAQGRRCVQIAAPFHADMPFTAVTIDAERTFSWHDATGYWSEPWDVSLPCTVF